MNQPNSYLSSFIKPLSPKIQFKHAYLFKGQRHSVPIGWHFRIAELLEKCDNIIPAEYRPHIKIENMRETFSLFQFNCCWEFEALCPFLLDNIKELAMAAEMELSHSCMRCGLEDINPLNLTEIRVAADTHVNLCSRCLKKHGVRYL